jgi:prepilin-type N-terminal cleavage/methylation domain-containing protein
MKNQTQKHSFQSGFTLIELLVVIAIIGLLSSVIMGSLVSAKGKAADAKTLQEMHQFQVAVQIFITQNNRYPDPEDTDWHCLAEDGCYYAGGTVAGLTGDLASLIPQKNRSSDKLTFIKKAEALMGDLLPGYLTINPIVSGGVTTYAGPMYRCLDASCTEADVLFTVKNPLPALSGSSIPGPTGVYQQTAVGSKSSSTYPN